MAFRRYSIGGVTDHPIEPLDPSGLSSNIRADTPASGHAEEQAEEQVEERDFEKAEAIAAYTRRRRILSGPRPAVRAEQIMSAPVISVVSSTGIDEAKKLFYQKRFRHVPVVSNEGVMVGIVSDRDFFALPDHHKFSTIEDIMSKGVLTASPNTGIREIARVLFEERIGCMPIVDDEGVVTGIITRSDILRALIKHAPLDLWI